MIARTVIKYTNKEFQFSFVLSGCHFDLVNSVQYSETWKSDPFTSFQNEQLKSAYLKNDEEKPFGSA